MDGSNVLGEYIYNGKGQRADKLISSQNKCTVFHYDQNGLLITESTRTGNIKAEYIYLNGQPLAKIENNNIYYYHDDHLGTPMVMTDSSGAVVWQGEFKPFGETLSITGSITNNLRFPGQYYDSETGLHQNWWRDYNTMIGRYPEADPIGIGRGINHLYVYSLNNPIIYIDPFGLLSYEEVSGLVMANNLSGQSDAMIVCICWKESSFDPMAQVGTHRGLMQIYRDALSDVNRIYKLNIDYSSLYGAATNIKVGSLYLGLRIQWAGGNVTNGLNGYGTGVGYATNILECEKCIKDNPSECQACPSKCEKCLNLIHP
ncbi:MAG: hypothetical protein A2W22_06240 [Candidatus Levybacteria bacterium RBG_16_35_11]|nr:MAG: hypothetical protein A2W22_06240 [Candidatus Levybacteria bacterium RBG_16_35_11]